jgi:hypothetical protein
MEASISSKRASEDTFSVTTWHHAKDGGERDGSDKMEADEVEADEVEADKVEADEDGNYVMYFRQVRQVTMCVTNAEGLGDLPYSHPIVLCPGYSVTCETLASSKYQRLCHA